MSFVSPNPPGTPPAGPAGRGRYADDPLFLSDESRVLRGVKRTVTVPAPASATDWSVTVPGGRQWRIRAAFATLVTSATAGSRFVGASITDGNATLWRMQNTAAHPASTTAGYTFAQTRAPLNITGISNFGPIELMFGWYPAGYTIASLVNGYQAGDQWSAVNIAIEELLFDDTTLTDMLQNELEGR